ncbi:hypothetical protein Q8791_30540 [Nocardiopsis sp. CT-R113]|uniref:Uncharacterized protein n=1 Tax=Nocardiopsis codii TaxID=3065942 RepID=A0ABU7KH48_9ACTN|nr:hypothetical protein [Nocardiopsis sp. CT-R113]MEE2041569.1 hypothetical protein [Nocardiopsis sp. CT-R113]
MRRIIAAFALTAAALGTMAAPAAAQDNPCAAASGMALLSCLAENGL